MERAGLLVLSLWLCLAVFTALPAAASEVVSEDVREVQPLGMGEEGLEAFPQSRRTLTSRYSYGMGCKGDRWVCRRKGSPGPNCCRNRCVNRKTDRNNCGKCGMMCKYGKTCCNGKCVNLETNRKHCGKCGHKCSRPPCTRTRARKYGSYGKVPKCPKAVCRGSMCNYGYGHGYANGYYH